jgi:hypothetical protein
MWSDDYEEEICTGWVYSGAKGRVLGTMAILGRSQCVLLGAKDNISANVIRWNKPASRF